MHNYYYIFWYALSGSYALELIYLSTSKAPRLEGGGLNLFFLNFFMHVLNCDLHNRDIISRCLRVICQCRGYFQSPPEQLFVLPISDELYSDSPHCQSQISKQVHLNQPYFAQGWKKFLKFSGWHTEPIMKFWYRIGIVFSIFR